MFKAFDTSLTFIYNGGSMPGSMYCLNSEQFQQAIPLPDWMICKASKIGDYNVWIGNHHDALSSQWLDDNITFIISLADFIPTGHHNHLFWPMQQPHTAKDFHTVARILNDLIERGERVLVHCYGGRDRSATTVLTWLVDHENFTPQQARDFIIKHRPIANPHIEWMDYK